MAESTLSVSLTDIDEAISSYLGYGWDTSILTTDEDNDVSWCRKRGLARFYRDHDWSFMSPVATLTTALGDYDQDLPDDFGYMRDKFFFPSDSGHAPVTITSTGKIMEMRSRSAGSGPMQYAAINPKAITVTEGVPSAGQRFEVIFYPAPDKAYVMTYRYSRMMNALTEGAPYPYGGAMHADTIIEACLAAAELTKNDELGAHEQRYRELLSVSIINDARMKPSNLGYNGDTSSGSGFSRPSRFCTYNGSIPE